MEMEAHAWVSLECAGGRQAAHVEGEFLELRATTCETALKNANA